MVQDAQRSSGLGAGLTPQQRRLAAKEMVDALGAAPFELAPAHKVPASCAPAQDALLTAADAARNALNAGLLLNRVDKISRGVSTRGAWKEPAQDLLRSSLLFACAGLDHALKLLVQEALGPLVDKDPNVKEKFEAWARQAITHRDSGGVDPTQLVQLLLGEGRTPKEVLVHRWAQTLTSGSAQSVERVYEIADALGASSKAVRDHLPKRRDTAKLKPAFEARNQMVHELDLTVPANVTRARFERRRRARNWEEVVAWSDECFAVTQAIITDTASRL